MFNERFLSSFNEEIKILMFVNLILKLISQKPEC